MKAAFLPVHWADLQGQVGVFIIAGRPLSGLAAASAIGAEPGPARGLRLPRGLWLSRRLRRLRLPSLWIRRRRGLGAAALGAAAVGAAVAGPRLLDRSIRRPGLQLVLTQTKRSPRIRGQWRISNAFDAGVLAGPSPRSRRPSGPGCDRRPASGGAAEARATATTSSFGWQKRAKARD